MTDSAEHPKRNLLSGEASPYLQQHADNPVWWLPWSEESFALARQLGKPIFLSIGYSTCYWCHVMEQDSFESQAVADQLNEHFICIKVDREERPDVDQVYIDAVVGMAGQAGWPLSVFLTPDLKPFYGATFFWKAQFLSVLEKIQDTWRERRGDVTASADRVAEALHDKLAPEEELPGKRLLFSAAFESLRQRFDEVNAGFGGAPKFPPHTAFPFLFRYSQIESGSDAQKMATATLEQMLSRGVFDQVGGGLHRYATDEQWLIPHFEKMLYDNALFALALVEAYQVSGDLRFRRGLEDTCDYILRDMRAPSGGFFAAEDAGEVDREGEFYVWDYEELQQVLHSEQFTLLQELCDISPAGNFEGKIILTFHSPALLERKSEPDVTALLRELFQLREASHKRPHRDEKVVCSWNAMTIRALAKAAVVVSKGEYLDAAVEAFTAIEEKLFVPGEGKLFRSFLGADPSKASATLEDFAQLIRASLDLFECGVGERYASIAKQLFELQERLLWDEDRLLYRASAAEELYVEKFERMDGVVETGNATTLGNLQRLEAIFGEDVFATRAAELLRGLTPSLNRAPSVCLGALSELIEVEIGKREVRAIDTQEALEEARKSLFSEFRPAVRFLGLTSSAGESSLPCFQQLDLSPEKTAYFVCRNRSCGMPKSSFEELSQQLRDNGGLSEP